MLQGGQQEMDEWWHIPSFLFAFSETENGDDFVVIVDDDGEDEEAVSAPDILEIIDEEERARGKKCWSKAVSNKELHPRASERTLAEK